MCKLSHKSGPARRGHYGARRQAGATLLEAMISLALSLVVTTAMVTLMGNSMGSATRIIEMSQLTDELRNAMSMMSRDVRRASRYGALVMIAPPLKRVSVGFLQHACKKDGQPAGRCKARPAPVNWNIGKPLSR
jgi:type II secretory pathway pseudopilin PulG